MASISTYFWTMTIIAAMVIVSLMHTEANVIKRSPSQICSKSTPCGWEVYKPYVRTIDYFVKSPCECPTGTHCVRTSDDLSIYAYVHRCRMQSNNAEDEWPSYKEHQNSADETNN